MPKRFAEYFSRDYQSAQRRFHTAARARGALLHRLPIDATGPDGTSLQIDIACFGRRFDQKILVHTCGLHGVEAFAGSAIQLALLDTLQPLPGEIGMVLVHVLNPYGMAWLRRANENNVDLNRNFLSEREPRPKTDSRFATFDPVLHPSSPPRADLFYLNAGLQVIRHGFEPIRQAIAQGQYEFPEGIFYGGRELQQGPRLYWDWARTNLLDVRQGVVIDVHTGLGKRGQETLFHRSGTTAASPAFVYQLLRNSNTVDMSGKHADSTAASAVKRHGYLYTGGHAGVYAANDQIEFMTQEFGTYNSIRMLHALREENRWHHHGNGSIAHPSKQRLKTVFCPESRWWRSRVVARGVHRVQTMLDALITDADHGCGYDNPIGRSS